MNWYQGSTLMYHLETVHISSDYNHIDCRFPVQSVIRPHTLDNQDFRGFTGRIDGGVFKPGDRVKTLPSGFVTTIKTIELSIESDVKKYFCVSTDKAANPVNMMGASKRIMELYLMKYSSQISISTARFANVAFSDGSLLHGFEQRFFKKQPISAPHDVRRYFVTSQESGELCLMSCIFGENRDIFFPKLSEKLHLITFSEIACRYLRERGYEPYECESEEEARDRAEELIPNKRWPCYFFRSDTTGEKDFEEFFTDNEDLDMERFETVGVIKNQPDFDEAKLDDFMDGIEALREKGTWTKDEIVKLYFGLLPEFAHKETGKYLDQRM